MSPVSSKSCELCQFFIRQCDAKSQFCKILKSWNFAKMLIFLAEFFQKWLLPWFLRGASEAPLGNHRIGTRVKGDSRKVQGYLEEVQRLFLSETRPNLKCLSRLRQDRDSWCVFTLQFNLVEIIRIMNSVSFWVLIYRFYGTMVKNSILSVLVYTKTQTFYYRISKYYQNMYICKRKKNSKYLILVEWEFLFISCPF